MILAVDGGGSGFRAASVEGKRVCILGESMVTSIEGLIEFVAKNCPEEAEGVAYAMAGVIKNHQRVIKSPNLPFLDNTNLGQLTESRLRKPVVVCNDMEAATQGMAMLFPKLEYFMGITWSSGIGLRIFKNGEILSNDCEGGHMLLDPSPFAQLCGCGQRGCAESILGGKSLQRRIMAETEIKGIKIPTEYMWPSIFLDLKYDYREEWAVEMYHSLAFGMAKFLTNIQLFFNLPAIVWKGALGRAVLQRKNQEIRQMMKEMIINPAWVDDLRFLYCWDVESCKDADALIGAAKLLIERK